MPLELFNASSTKNQFDHSSNENKMCIPTELLTAITYSLASPCCQLHLTGQTWLNAIENYTNKSD